MTTTLENVSQATQLVDIDALGATGPYRARNHEIISDTAADLAMVFGGQDVVDHYAGDDTVFTNGPGRTKIVITAEKDWRD